MRTLIADRALSKNQVLLAAALLGPLVLRVPSFFEPHWYGDEGIFAAVAYQLLSGDVLYADTWDHKPPLIFLLYGAVIAGFGDGIVALRAATTVAVIATQLLLFAGASMFVDRTKAGLAAGVYGILMAIPLFEGHLALTEVFMVVLTTAAIISYIRARRDNDDLSWQQLLSIGVLLGLASSFKPVALLDAAALVTFVILCAPRPLHSAGWITLGCSLPWVTFAGIFSLLGALPEFVDANLHFQLQYIGSSAPSSIPLLALLGPPVLATAYVWHFRKHRSLHALPVLWLGFTIAGVAVGGLPFAHYVIHALPALSLLFAIALSGSPSLRVTSAVLAMILLVFTHSFMGLTRTESFRGSMQYYQAAANGLKARDVTSFHAQFPSWEATRQLMVVLDRHLEHREERSVMIWGERPWAYALTSATPATRFVVWYHANGNSEREDEVITILLSKPEGLVIIEDDVPVFTRLEALVSDHYVCEIDTGYRVCIPAAASVTIRYPAPKLNTSHTEGRAIGRTQAG